MSHTQGPWNIRSFRRDFYVCGGVDGSDEELWITVQTPGDGIRADNARLIAAAPDMLDALQSIAEHYLEFDGIEDAETMLARIAEKARFAIAKAKGE